MPMGHFSAWAGAMALAIIMIPVVVRTTEDMLRLVPSALREAAAALGAPKWKIIVTVAYRAAVQGMLTGVLLAVARISGETAPLVVHRAQQPVLEHRPQRADGQPAGRDLPVRDEPLRRLADARLGRRAADHRGDPLSQHHAPASGLMEQLQTMNPRLALSIDAESEDARATLLPRAAGSRARGARQRRARSAGRAHAVGPAPPVKVDIRNVDFYYGKFQALHGISLPLYDRRVTAFIGPSGCGKSTLLRILNRIYELYPGQVATGEVLVDGAEHPGARARPQSGCAPGSAWCSRSRRRSRCRSTTTSPSASGSTRGCRKPSSTTASKSALRRAALWDEVKDKLRQSGLSLSGGQQQRLCIARAIAIEPEILLLDEPASALDPISTQRIEELIAELKADYCIAIVTHNMQQAARSSDYTAFLYLGELIEFDETERIFTHPRAKRTEDYITGRFG